MLWIEQISNFALHLAKYIHYVHIWNQRCRQDQTSSDFSFWPNNYHNFVEITFEQIPNQRSTPLRFQICGREVNKSVQTRFVWNTKNILLWDWASEQIFEKISTPPQISKLRSRVKKFVQTRFVDIYIVDCIVVLEQIPGKSLRLLKFQNNVTGFKKLCRQDFNLEIKNVVLEIRPILSKS